MNYLMDSRPSKHADPVGARAQRRRRFRKAGVLVDEVAQPAWKLGKLRGPNFAGKDELGRRVDTRPPNLLKLDFGTNLGMVIEFAGGMPRGLALPDGVCLEQYGRKKKKLVLKCKTDALKAVRTLKGLREWHGRRPDSEMSVEMAAYLWLQECCARSLRDTMLAAVVGRWADEFNRFGCVRADYWREDIRSYMRIRTALMVLRENRLDGADRAAAENGAAKARGYIADAVKELPRHVNALIAGKKLETADKLLGAGIYNVADKYIFEAGESIGRCKPWWLVEEFEKTRDLYTRDIEKGLRTATVVLLEDVKIPEGIGILRQVAEEFRKSR